jgi:hypothetical protein
MNDDPIVAEVRKIRAEHAARFRYDLEAIYRDLKDKENTSGRRFVSDPPRLAGGELRIRPRSRFV